MNHDHLNPESRTELAEGEQKQNPESERGHMHNWWHLALCLSMIGAFFLLGFRGENSYTFKKNADSPEKIFVEKRAVAGDVTVIAKPRKISGGIAFDLTFDTHSGELDFDAARDIAMIDANGKEFPPEKAEGDPAGGHHRKITASFKALPQIPFSLLIRDVGGEPSSILKW